jgi:leucyl aminopeptidase
MFRSLIAAGLMLSAGPALAQTIRFAEPAQPSSGKVAIPLAAGTMAGPAAALNTATNGALDRALKAAKFTAAPGQSVSLFGVGGFEQVIVLGVGDGKLNRVQLEDAGGAIVTEAAKGSAGDVAIWWPEATTPQANEAAHVAFGVRLASFSYTEFKGLTKKAPAQRSYSVRTEAAAGVERAYGRFAATAEGVELARNLISLPSNIKSPEEFVRRTRAAFAGVKNVEITVIDEKRAAELGMGQLIGVGQGSTRPPRLMIVHYKGAAPAIAPVAFVGKGITFDTGGISIKPAADMWRMRYDMSGAAASVGAVLALAKRGADTNVIGVAALAENMPDGGAIRPGDVLTSVSGKTVEVLNTDAEGRLVLGDANWYAQETFKPRLLVNIATLTGSARAALGDEYAALFTKDGDDTTAAMMRRAGAASGETLWQLPLDKSHHEDIKSQVADIKNVVEGGSAGASIAAAFLAEFVKPETRWAHLDIAGMAWRDRAQPTIPAGAVGFGVRLFEQLVASEYEGK